MFTTISWQEFLYAVVLTTGTYYVIIIILFFRKEVIARFKGNENSPSTLKPGPTIPSTSSVADLMGKIRTEEVAADDQRESTTDSEQLQFSTSNEGDEQSEPITQARESNSDALLIGTVSDFLQEVKSLAQVVSDSNGSKAEAAVLFKSLLARYHQLMTTHYFEAINLFIYNACQENSAIEVQLHEIGSWWPQEQSNITNNQ